MSNGPGRETVCLRELVEELLDLCSGMIDTISVYSFRGADNESKRLADAAEKYRALAERKGGK